MEDTEFTDNVKVMIAKGTAMYKESKAMGYGTQLKQKYELRRYELQHLTQNKEHQPKNIILNCLSKRT